MLNSVLSDEASSCEGFGGLETRGPCRLKGASVPDVVCTSVTFSISEIRIKIFLKIQGRRLLLISLQRVSF